MLIPWDNNSNRAAQESAAERYLIHVAIVILDCRFIETIDVKWTAVANNTLITPVELVGCKKTRSLSRHTEEYYERIFSHVGFRLRFKRQSCVDVMARVGVSISL